LFKIVLRDCYSQNKYVNFGQTNPKLNNILGSKFNIEVETGQTLSNSLLILLKNEIILNKITYNQSEFVGFRELSILSNKCFPQIKSIPKEKFTKNVI